MGKEVIQGISYILPGDKETDEEQERSGLKGERVRERERVS